LPEVEAKQARRGHDLIAQAVDEAGVLRIDLGPSLGVDATPLYRDHIHLGERGQQAL
jgi:hypothetical protein